jgi:hypothetical protein
MNKFLFGTAALALLSVGCVSPEAVCKSSVDQVCERNFECRSAEFKASEQFQLGYGSSVEECKTKLYNSGKCEEKKEDNDNCTGANAGKTFNLDKASECSDARAKLSCEDYLDPAKTPAACAQVCT